jgi:hypothetical protein
MVVHVKGTKYLHGLLLFTAISKIIIMLLYIQSACYIPKARGYFMANIITHGIPCVLYGVSSSLIPNVVEEEHISNAALVCWIVGALFDMNRVIIMVIMTYKSKSFRPLINIEHLSEVIHVNTLCMCCLFASYLYKHNFFVKT